MVPYRAVAGKDCLAGVLLGEDRWLSAPEVVACVAS